MSELNRPTCMGLGSNTARGFFEGGIKKGNLQSWDAHYPGSAGWEGGAPIDAQQPVYDWALGWKRSVVRGALPSFTSPRAARFALPISRPLDADQHGHRLKWSVAAWL